MLPLEGVLGSELVGVLPSDPGEKGPGVDFGLIGGVRVPLVSPGLCRWVRPSIAAYMWADRPPAKSLREKNLTEALEATRFWETARIGQPAAAGLHDVGG